MTKFVTAYSRSTGQKQRIPESWLDHEVLGKDFRRTPSDEARQQALADGPSDVWTVAELADYAAQHDIALGGATRKADILAAVLTTNTPDAGE